MLRLVRQEGELRPGTSRTITHGEPHLHVRRRHAQHRLARRRHRPLRVRQRLPGARPAKPLSHLRPGRAADRRPPHARRRRSGRALLSAQSCAFRSRRFLRVSPLDASGSAADPTRTSSIRRRSRTKTVRAAGRLRPTLRARAVRFARSANDRGRRPRRAARSRPLDAAGLLPQPAAVSRQPSSRRWACSTRARPRSCRASTCSSRTTRTRCRSSWSTACGRARSPGWRCSTTCGAIRWSASTTSSGSTCIRPASRSGSAPRRCAKTWR